jgi:hypothetical protein
VREARLLLDRLAATIRPAAAESMTEDARAAHQLVAERAAFRDLKAAATRARFAGLRGGKEVAGGLDRDLLRKLKRSTANWWQRPPIRG